jgi:hypothetical protein
MEVNCDYPSDKKVERRLACLLARQQSQTRDSQHRICLTITFDLSSLLSKNFLPLFE